MLMCGHNQFQSISRVRRGLRFFVKFIVYEAERKFITNKRNENLIGIRIDWRLTIGMSIHLFHFQWICHKQSTDSSICWIHFWALNSFDDKYQFYTHTYQPNKFFHSARLLKSNREITNFLEEAFQLLLSIQM